jgi:hypothetical protein
MPDHHDKPNQFGDKPMFGVGPGHQFYAELTRIVTILFAGVLALMTFLLTVGFQRPHANFSYALYTTLVVLALNLVAYVAGHLFFMRVIAARPAELAVEDKVEADKDNDKDKDKDDSKVVTKSAKSKFESAKQQLKVMRIVQQVLFVAAVVCVTWLALATAHFFFTIPTSTTGATGQ